MTKRWLTALSIAFALALPAAGLAQTSPPAMPTLTTEQSAELQRQMATERRAMEARVARGDVTPDEAERFLGWREWQIGQQLAGLAPAPSAAPPQPPTVVARRYAYPYPYPPPYDAPAPYYWGPRYYGGPVVCAGGWGHHGGGSVCF